MKHLLLLSLIASSLFAIPPRPPDVVERVPVGRIPSSSRTSYPSSPSYRTPALRPEIYRAPAQRSEPNRGSSYDYGKARANQLLDQTRSLVPWLK